MQSLNQITDGNGKAIPVLPLSDYRNHHITPGGQALQIPTGARFVRVTAFAAEVWLRFGTTNDITAAAPTGAIVDGSAPAYLPAFAAEMYALNASRFVALISAGNVLVEYFG